MENIIVLDTETTGLNPLTDRIITIGLWHVNKFVKFVSNDEKEMLENFWKFISEHEISKLIGFNINFDWTFLKLRSMKYGIKIRYFKKYEERVDLRRILNSEPRAKGTLTDYCVRSSALTYLEKIFLERTFQRYGKHTKTVTLTHSPVLLNTCS
uniref:YprB ribonuclease H-like domain-containing protein n=1 Tax=Methanococcus maripaludis (strain C6 / ATCC BAA-1332) TaxID=444158 RepID=A9A7W1_METM6